MLHSTNGIINPITTSGTIVAGAHKLVVEKSMLLNVLASSRAQQLALMPCPAPPRDDSPPGDVPSGAGQGEFSAPLLDGTSETVCV